MNMQRIKSRLSRNLAPPQAKRRSTRGFTLIELVVVMSVIALLLTLAVPRYFQALENSRLQVQRQNLAAIRDAIDKYFGDQGIYPSELQDLVSKRYLREIPLDPVSESNQWTILPPPDSTQGAVYDITPPVLAQAPQ